MTRISPLLRGVALGIAVLSLAPVAAHADVRAGSISDPQDQTPTIDGSLTTPDIAAVSASYDASGTASATVTFHQPIPTTSSRTVALGLSARLSPSYVDGGLNCEYVTEPGVSLHLTAPLDGTSGLASLSGYAGSLPVALSWDGARTQLSLSVTSPMLANRDFRCATDTQTFFSVNDCGSYWPPPAGCLRNVYEDRAAPFAFAGFAPAVPGSDADAPPAPATITALQATQTIGLAVDRNHSETVHHRHSTCAPNRGPALTCRSRWIAGHASYSGTVAVTVSGDPGLGWIGDERVARLAFNVNRRLSSCRPRRGRPCTKRYRFVRKVELSDALRRA